MTRRFVAAFGIAATLVLANVASGADAPPPTPRPAPAPATPVPPPRSLVVALGLGSPTLQAGVVRGREVILARGYEVALAKVLAKRLGLRVERFVHVPSKSRLLAAGGASWHVALGALERQRGGRGSSVLTAPYLTTDVAVVLRRGLSRPRRLSDLRTAPSSAPSAGAPAPPRSRACVPPPGRSTSSGPSACGRWCARVPATLRSCPRSRWVASSDVTAPASGPVVGRIHRGEGLGASIPPGTGLRLADVNRELARLRRDGTLGRLARTWLGLDPAGLPVLR